MKKSTIILAAALLFGATAQADVYFGSPAGAGDKTGASWENALEVSDLNELYEEIQEGDIVYLLEGTYPTLNHVTVKVGTTIIGGYPATATGTDVSGYNPWKNRTIIDAEKKNTGNQALMKLSGTDATTNPLTTIKGIVITNCEATSSMTSYCGSVFNCTHAYVLLEDDTFENNSSWQGGIIAPAGASRFHAKHCVWNGNKNIRNVKGGDTDGKNNMFQSILSGRGDTGSFTNIVLEGCVMVNNTTESADMRALACYGGAMSMQDGVVNLCMVNCLVDGGGQTTKANGGFLRTSNKSTLHFFAFNTIKGYGVQNATAKGHAISINGDTPFYMMGNIITSSKSATADNDAANSALYVQTWNTAYDMANIKSGGNNSISGTKFDTYTAACTFKTQQVSDNFLAPKQDDIFGSHEMTAKDGRYFILPQEDYKNVSMKEALDNYGEFAMPDCFKWANIDLSTDLFGHKRAALTYRGAYDPNATEIMIETGVKDALAVGGALQVRNLGGGQYAIEGGAGLAEVFDMAGRKVMAQQVEAGSILSLQGLGNGIYVVRLGTSAFKISK